MWGVESFIFARGSYTVPVGGLVRGAFENDAAAGRLTQKIAHEHNIFTAFARGQLEISGK